MDARDSAFRSRVEPSLQLRRRLLVFDHLQAHHQDISPAFRGISETTAETHATTISTARKGIVGNFYKPRLIKDTTIYQGLSDCHSIYGVLNFLPVKF